MNTSNRRLGTNPHIADTRDDQTVRVGSECIKLIRKAGDLGYQPPLGGPRLYPIQIRNGAIVRTNQGPKSGTTTWLFNGFAPTGEEEKQP